MSENAAGEETLGLIHSELTEAYRRALKGTPLLEDGKVVRDSDGSVVYMPPDPRILSSLTTFLNNNKIKARPFLDAAVSEIEEKLAKRKTRFKGNVVDMAKRAADAS